MSKPERWTRVTVDVAQRQPDPVLLADLVDGEVAVLVLRNLLPRHMFADGLDRLRRLFAAASTTTYVNGSLTTVGPYLAKYLSDVAAYFQAAKEASVMLEDVGFELAPRVRSALRAAFGLSSLEPAREPDGREYAESVVRIHADGVSNPLHNDNIMRDAAGTGLVLSELAHQLSCVVCLQECASGGELQMYRRSWTPEDERYKIRGGLGYDERVVAGVPVHEFKPEAGDVYLINPTHYHAIARVEGADRLTMGFFIGLPDDRLDSAVVWG
jgi:hypothetical protein